MEKLNRNRNSQGKAEIKNYSVGGPLKPVNRSSIIYPVVSLLMNMDNPGESLSFSMKLIFVKDLSK